MKNIDYATLPREASSFLEWVRAGQIRDSLGVAPTPVQVSHLERSLSAVIREEDRQIVNQLKESLRFQR